MIRSMIMNELWHGCTMDFVKRDGEVNMDEKKVEKGGRISGTVTQVNKSDILLFYENRAKKFKEENPYAVTMFQDQNPQLVRDRNKRETEKLFRRR